MAASFHLSLVAQIQTVSEMSEQDVKVCVDINPAADLDIF